MAMMPRILIISRTTEQYHPVCRDLQAHDIHVDAVTSHASILEQIQHITYDLIFLDVALPETSGIELIPRISITQPSSPIILVAEASETGTAIDGILAGASDFIFRPLTIEKIHKMIAKFLTITPDTELAGSESVADATLDSPRQLDAPPALHRAPHSLPPHVSLGLPDSVSSFIQRVKRERHGVEAIIGLGIAIAGINVIIFALSQILIGATLRAFLATTGCILALVGVQVLFLSYLIGSLHGTVAAHRRSWNAVILLGLGLVICSSVSFVLSSPTPVAEEGEILRALTTVRFAAVLMGLQVTINASLAYRIANSPHHGPRVDTSRAQSRSSNRVTRQEP
jgi:response regulator of citrate/malate metabolism